MTGLLNFFLFLVYKSALSVLISEGQIFSVTGAWLKAAVTNQLAQHKERDDREFI